MAHRDGRDRGDRGVSAMEWALLTPVMLLVIMLVIQFTLVYHARHVALAAAQAGARVARSQPDDPGWQAAATDRATQSVTRFGPKLLSGLTVTAGETGGGTGDQRFVEVRGKAVNVVPFLSFTVTQRSQGPVECFRPDDGGTDCE